MKGQSERMWVWVDELEVPLLSPEDKICIADGYQMFVVNEKLWRKDVADAVRFAEQARNESEEEQTNRTAELRTSQVSATKFSDETQKM